MISPFWLRCYRVKNASNCPYLSPREVFFLFPKFAPLPSIVGASGEHLRDAQGDILAASLGYIFGNVLGVLVVLLPTCTKRCDEKRERVTVLPSPTCYFFLYSKTRREFSYYPCQPVAFFYTHFRQKRLPISRADFSPVFDNWF